jgi:putative transcriptional regulator
MKAKKRSLFNELLEGMQELSRERDGKVTLRRHVVERHPVPEVSGREILKLRRELNMSRGVFAAYLRTNVRTLENWEQGRARPNAQASLLIRLVQRFPDTIGRLAEI